MIMIKEGNFHCNFQTAVLNCTKTNGNSVRHRKFDTFKCCLRLWWKRRSKTVKKLHPKSGPSFSYFIKECVDSYTSHWKYITYNATLDLKPKILKETAPYTSVNTALRLLRNSDKKSMFT